MNAEQIDVNNNERIFYSVGPINYLSVAIDIIKIIIILKSIRRAITYVFKTCRHWTSQIATLLGLKELSNPYLPPYLHTYFSTGGSTLLARLGRKNHSPRDAALLYSSLKADLHLQTCVTRYRGFLFFFSGAWYTRARTRCAYVCNTCGSLKRRYRRRTCGTPRRRLMHFYGG